MRQATYVPAIPRPPTQHPYERPAIVESARQGKPGWIGRLHLLLQDTPDNVRREENLSILLETKKGRRAVLDYAEALLPGFYEIEVRGRTWYVPLG